MFVTNWNSTTKIQKISEITNFFRHYFLSRTEVGFYYIDNQTLCISIPRWHLWFELKEHQMFRKLRNNLKIVRSLRTVSNCFFLFLGPIIAVSLTNVRMIWTKPCSLQERHGKITLLSFKISTKVVLSNSQEIP